MDNSLEGETPQPVQEDVVLMPFSQLSASSEKASTEESDEELLARIRRGDKEASTVLLERYYKKFRPYFLARVFVVLDKGDIVNDLVHEVVVRIWTKLPDYQPRPDIPFSAWAYVIAKNVLYEHKAEQNKRQMLSNKLNLNEEMLPDNFEKLEEQEILQQVKNQLSDDDNHILSLRHQGYSLEEIAAHLNRTYGAIRKRYSRILTKIRRFSAL